MFKWISSLFTDDKCGSEIVGNEIVYQMKDMIDVLEN